MRRAVLQMMLALIVSLISFNALTLSESNNPGSVSPLAVETPAVDIPDEGLAAEGRHEWQQAISIYLTRLLTHPNQVELWLRIASIEHELKQYNLAIDAYQHAVMLRPNDASLYKTISEIYGELNQPHDALLAINKAVELSSNNSDYLAAQTTIVHWNTVAQHPDKHPNEPVTPSKTRMKTTVVLSKKALMLNLAHTLAWHGKTDASILAYQRCLGVYPDMAEAWIQYAEVLSWIGRYIDALDALDHYQHIAGKNSLYFEKQARVLAMIGYFKSALVINRPLIQKKPDDPYRLSTNVIAFIDAFQINPALIDLNKASRLGSKDPQVIGLKKITLTPLRSNMTMEADYTAASDTTQIMDLPISADYGLSPSTRLLFQGLYERASAAPKSRLGPVGDSGDAIADESAKIGFAKQINGLNLKGLVGALHIQHKNNHGIYDATFNTNVNQTAEITILTLHNLYRPYLVPQTPKLISLQIMETRLGTEFQWQPFVQKYLNITASYSNLTNNNRYTHLNVWPKARVYGSEHWTMTIGVDGDFWQYRRRATDGYYSPLHFDGYEGTLELYYAYSENVGVGLSGGFGMQKDETFPHYFYEEDLGAHLFMGIFTDWALQAKAGYTLRENPLSHYDCWSVGLILTRRFK